MAIDDCLHYVETLDLFEDFTPHERNMFASLAGLRRLAPDDMLCAEGDETGGFYVIVSGRLRFAKRTGGGAIETLYRIGAGRAVGHAWLIDGGAQSVTILADEPSVVLEYPRRQFLRHFQTGSRYSIKLRDMAISQLSGQLRDANVALAGLAESGGDSAEALRSLLDQIIESASDVGKAAGSR